MAVDKVPTSTLTELSALSASSGFRSPIGFSPPGQSRRRLGNHAAFFENDQDESDYDVFVAWCRSSHSITPLATWHDNTVYLAASPTALRFAYSCVYMTHSGVHSLAFACCPVKTIRLVRLVVFLLRFGVCWSPWMPSA
ncbi:hypothetical protein AHF37_03220 [Paragonimus kellicotti]|nr:hypothetical protein AHF37_03220 [Paragonimus kellicotti]